MKSRKETAPTQPNSTHDKDAQEALALAQKSAAIIEHLEPCISCGGVFKKSSMILVGRKDGVGTNIFGFACRADEDVMLCKSCAQIEDNIKRCIQYPLRDRRKAERRGQPTGDPQRDNAIAAVNATRVSPGQPDE